MVNGSFGRASLVVGIIAHSSVRYTFAPTWLVYAHHLLLIAGLGESVGLVLSLLGKCAVAGSFCIIYLYTAELFPTEVRCVIIG